MKKIGSVLMGALLAGSTLMGSALAGDLGAYPSPFVKDGKLDAVIVVGAGAATGDVVGAINIGANLAQGGAGATSLKLSSSASTTVTGGVLVGVTDDKLNIEETLANAKATIRAKDLDILKCDGKEKCSFSSKTTSYDYTQKIVFLTTPRVTFTEKESGRSPEMLIDGTATDTDFIEYKVNFLKQVETDIVTTGTTTLATSGDLYHIKGKKITMLGKEYTITKATGDTTNDDITIELMGGAALKTLSSGESGEYTIGGKTYKITASIYSSTAKFDVSVDGGALQSTGSISAGETYKLSDGTEIGVQTISTSTKENVVDSVDFFIGAQKITLADTDYDTENAHTDRIQVGSTDVDGMYVEIAVTESSTQKLKISKISISERQKSRIQLNGAETYTDKVFGAFKVTGPVISTEASEVIKLNPASATDKVSMTVPTSAGDVTFDAFYYAGGHYQLGYDSDRYLVNDEGRASNTSNLFDYANNDRDQYFIVSSSTTKETYVLGLSDYDSTNDIVKFKDKRSGDEYTVTYVDSTSPMVPGTNSGTLDIGELTIDVAVDEVDSTHAYIWADLDDSGTFGDNPNVPLYTSEGGTIYLIPSEGNVTGFAGTQGRTAVNGGAFINITIIPNKPTRLAEVPGIAIVEEKQTDPATATYGVVWVPLVGSTTNNYSTANAPTYCDGVSSTTAVEATNYILKTVEDSKVSEDHTRFGTKVKRDATSDQATVEITYPGAEATVNVYVMDTASTAVAGEEVSSTLKSADLPKTYKGTTKLLELGGGAGIALPKAGMAKLDSEAEADKSASNLILVGGPAINTLVAELAVDATKGVRSLAVWREDLNADGVADHKDEAVLQVVDGAFAAGKSALIVGGYEAADTQRACYVVQNAADFKKDLSGKAKALIGGTKAAPTVSLLA